MASVFHFVMLLCLTSGLVMGDDDILTRLVHDVRHCPDGWTHDGSRCVAFFHHEKTWLDAESACINYGANLASIHSLEEHNFLRGVIARVTGSNKRTWIGGFDGMKEGVWQWTDGSKFDYTHWYKGEPNNLKVENCLEMNFRGGVSVKE
ncbi:galactose-specific lectin nattectin-like [Centroberyx affinis]|uniref:galactose-specific lectin nattectin-like n=1 Tax=Centroberyx affinis TaxID=166261 RepID=UPI003A5C6A50